MGFHAYSFVHMCEITFSHVLVNVSLEAFFSFADLFKSTFSKFQELQWECQTVWIQIKPGILSGLIWAQNVCKSYQQTTLEDKELSNLIGKPFRNVSSSLLFGLFIATETNTIITLPDHFSEIHVKENTLWRITWPWIEKFQCALY